MEHKYHCNCLKCINFELKNFVVGNRDKCALNCKYYKEHYHRYLDTPCMVEHRYCDLYKENENEN